MKRDLSHLRETVACRAFEYMLDPHLLAHPTRQGLDYGVDYIVSVFGPEGEPDWSFNVQVKYVNPRSVSKPSTSQKGIEEYERNFRTIYPTSIARVRLDKRHLRNYLDRIRTPADTLLVAANENDFFYLWLNDLYDYYLRWLPGVINGDGTLTIILNSIRSLIRRWDGRLLRPGEESYALGLETLLLGKVDTKTPGWLGYWCKPGTIDSVQNVALSAYLQTVDPRTKYRFEPDLQGYWNFLAKEKETKVWVRLVLGNYLSLLPATSEMIAWAIKTLRDWNCVWDIPTAFYVLTGSLDLRAAREGIDLLQGIEDTWHDYWRQYFELHKMTDQEDSRFDFEYLRSIAYFLATCVHRHRLVEGQRALVRAFGNFDYSLSIPNVFANALVSLVRRRRLLTDKSLKTLLHWCAVSASDPPSKVADAIYDTTGRWETEAFNDK